MLASAVASRRDFAADSSARFVKSARRCSRLCSGLVMLPVGTGRARRSPPERGQGLRVVLRARYSRRSRGCLWEAMYDGTAGAYVCTARSTGPAYAGCLGCAAANRGSHRCGSLASSPPREGLAPLDVEREQENLARALARPRSEGLIDVRWAPRDRRGRRSKTCCLGEE